MPGKRTTKTEQKDGVEDRPEQKPLPSTAKEDVVSAAKLTLTDLLGLVEAGRMALDCDRAGNPIILLPDTLRDLLWPLIRSNRVRAWIARHCFRNTGELLLDREIDRIVNILEGEAFARRTCDGTGDEGLVRAVERDAVATAILRYMEERDRYCDGVGALFKTLDSTWGARSGGFQEKWPGASWVFSHRLRECSALLQRAGLQVQLRRDNRGCRITIEKLARNGDGPSVTAPPEASPPKSSPSNGFDASDAPPPDNHALAIEYLNRIQFQPKSPKEAKHE
jgi:hypothetical protein